MALIRLRLEKLPKTDWVLRMKRFSTGLVWAEPVANAEPTGLVEALWALLQRDLARFPLERLTDGSCIPFPETAKICQLNAKSAMIPIRFSALISFEAQMLGCCGEPPEPESQQAWLEGEIDASGGVWLVEEQE